MTGNWGAGSLSRMRSQCTAQAQRAGRVTAPARDCHERRRGPTRFAKRSHAEMDAGERLATARRRLPGAFVLLQPLVAQGTTSSGKAGTPGRRRLKKEKQRNSAPSKRMCLLMICKWKAAGVQGAGSRSGGAPSAAGRPRQGGWPGWARRGSRMRSRLFQANKQADKLSGILRRIIKRFLSAGAQVWLRDNYSSGARAPHGGWAQHGMEIRWRSRLLF